jgi:HD-like signal output (HDOD) protein
MAKVPIKREKRLKLIQNYIDRMPSLSITVTKVLEICNAPRTSPNDLNRVISLDPVLTGRVLNLINSAYYSLPKKVNSLTRAIIMLGLNTVVNLAVSTAILESLGGKGTFQALSMDGFWTHSLCVGVTAKTLAAIKDVPLVELEEYFVAGLLHDLGKIPLNKRFSDEYVQALKLSKREQGPLHGSENGILDVDHCVVGKMIAGKWSLSEALNDVLSYHHNPTEAKEENRQLVEIVGLANIYANIFDIGSSGDPFPEDLMVPYLLDQVGVSWTMLFELGETVVLDEIEKARIFLQFTQKGQPYEDQILGG